MKSSFFLTIFLSLFFYNLYSIEESRLLRFPAVSNEKIVFSYGGDLYLTSINGGMTQKITTNKGYEMFARFSPDGKKIAFTAQYDGNTEVYVMPCDGGMPVRLTFSAAIQRDDVSDRMGPNNIVIGWTPDGKYIIYRTRQYSFNDFKGMLMEISPDGGMPLELPFSVGGFCSFSPDGKKIAYNRVFREFRTWKRYRGGMADDIWIYDFQTKKTINITQNKAQDIIPMWIDNNIYFLSDRDETMNLYVYHLDNSSTEQLTFFKDFDIKFPSNNDKYIVFENAGYIYKYDIVLKKLEKLNIIISDDKPWCRPEFKDASQYIRTYDVSPNGDRVVFGARGDVFTVPAGKGITRNITSTTDVHEKDVTWSPDGKYIAYLSDKSGEFEIYIQPTDPLQEPIQLTRDADTYKFQIKWSPDSKKILWTDRKFRLQYVDIETKTVHLVSQSDIWYIQNYSWSPDSKWIVFTQPVANRYSVVYVYNTKDKSIHNITDEWFDSNEPVFSSDGKYIAFVSARSFSPIYSETEFNHVYINMSKIYLILLKNNTPSPFAPKIIESTNSSDSLNKDNVSVKNKKIEVDIDFDGITQRIVDVPIRPSNYSNINVIDNYIYYIDKYKGESPVLKVYNLEKHEETELGKNLDYKISASKKKMLISDVGKYSVIDLPNSKISLKDYIDLSGMKVWVDYSKEWVQIFNEAWRQMRDFFYVENMHGVDWNATKKQYEPLVKYVSHRDDLTYIIGEMIGELNVGHAYTNSGEKPKVERIPIGLLGAKISKHSSGYFIIDKIFEGASWDPSLHSPLTEPGINVKEGDFILEIDGVSLKNIDNLYKCLIYKNNREVQITVNSVPIEKGSRKVIVKPVSTESQLVYYNWVQNNIRKVDKATNGQVGYIHIPDMVTEGLNEFTKYFYPQLDKKVLIIDERGNGGGNVSPQIIERLRRELTTSRMIRNSKVPYTSPDAIMIGPKIMLIDQYSASDGDLFPYAFKKHNLGVLIGQRTWGGVIGISGSLPFIDGTELRRPEYASYSSDSSTWIIEGIGVEPDIEVVNDPVREYEGIDDQLDKAIQVAIEKLKEYKPLPDIPKAPDKSKKK